MKRDTPETPGSPGSQTQQLPPSVLVCRASDPDLDSNLVQAQQYRSCSRQWSPPSPWAKSLPLFWYYSFIKCPQYRGNVDEVPVDFHGNKKCSHLAALCNSCGESGQFLIPPGDLWYMVCFVERAFLLDLLVSTSDELVGLLGVPHLLHGNATQLKAHCLTCWSVPWPASSQDVEPVRQHSRWGKTNWVMNADYDALSNWSGRISPLLSEEMH